MTLDVSADLDINLQLGRVADRLDKDAEERRRDRETARARVPSIVRIQNSGVIPTPTAPFGLNMGGPDAGFEWVVRGLVIGGLTWSTTAAGSAEVYVSGLGAQWGTAAGGAGTAAGVRSLSDLVDQAASLPSKGFYGREQLVIKESESLIVVINGGTAAQQYVAAMRCQVVRTAAALWGAKEGI